MTAINTDNLSDDFVNNLIKIFDGNMTVLGIKEIFRDDVIIVSVTPSLAISTHSIFFEQRTIGSSNVRYTFNFIGELWYYHESLTADTNRNRVMRSAYKISEHIIKNASLNNWLTNSRAVVRSCSYAIRVRSRSYIASARIIVSAPYLATISTIS